MNSGLPRFRSFRARTILALATGCLLASFTAQAVAGDRRGVLVDTNGAIAAILLHYDPELKADLSPLYEDLFQVLPDDVRVTIAFPSDETAKEFSDEWSRAIGTRSVDIVNVGFPLSIWARDRFIGRQDSSGYIPVGNDSYEIEKHNDLLALEVMSEARLLPRTVDASLHIEGGNVVSNLKHVFVGANVFTDNSDLGRDVVAQELRTLFGRRYVPVAADDGNVPWCHVDMYLTPISDDTVLVANPQMAELILSLDSEQEWDDSVAGLTASESGVIQNRLDDVASLALERGYKVIRLPALVNSSDAWMVTYNNVLIDDRASRKRVYMPTYDIPALDHAAAAIYLGLGFDVVGIDMSRLYARGGALRCLVNVIERANGTSARSNLARHQGLIYHNLAGSQQYERMLHRSYARLVRRGTRS